MVLIKKKDKKILFLAAAVGCFLTATQGIAVSDSFLNPADNAYSLKKVFLRPSLQNSPIPQVWQTDSKSEDFRRAWLDALTPPTSAERQMKALSWQIEVQDDFNALEKITTENPVKDWDMVNRVLRALFPVVEQAEENTAFGSDMQDVGYIRSYVRNSDRENDALSEDIKDVQAFFAVLDKTARTDMELAHLNTFVESVGSKTDRKFVDISRLFFTEDVLKSADDIYSVETHQMQGLRETDDVLAALMINDMMDLATGTIILSGDDEFFKQPVEKTSFSSSLLDRVEKTDQIHKVDPVSRRKIFFKRLEKFLKGDKVKDVK